jgi:hypothetical protein
MCLLMSRERRKKMPKSGLVRLMVSVADKPANVYLL